MDSDTNPFRYCSEYFDCETKTYYLRARYYNPWSGRFVTEDSVHSMMIGIPEKRKAVDPLSLNLYLYCSNNPILFVDPSGTSYEYTIGEKTQTIYGVKSKTRWYLPVDVSITDFWGSTQHRFYIWDGDDANTDREELLDVIKFSNEQESLWQATRGYTSKEFTTAMMDAFEEAKGRKLSGRTIDGLHTELVVHDLGYRLPTPNSIKESGKMADMGTAYIPGLAKILPNYKYGNDPGAIGFEASTWYAQSVI